MPSKRERVIQAVADRIKVALPGAKHFRNEAKSQAIPAGGYVNVEDGDPGEPDVTLNPATYIYDHEIPVEIAANKTKTVTAEAALDTLMQAIGTAIAADRTLGGLCDYLAVGAPDTEPLTTDGAPVSRSATIIVVATYGTTDPLN